jgi:hypothetical protein
MCSWSASSAFYHLSLQKTPTRKLVHFGPVDEQPDSRERALSWYHQVLEAITRTLEKPPAFRKASHHDLLIYKDADVLFLRPRTRTSI